jgi:hypothetical protein
MSKMALELPWNSEPNTVSERKLVCVSKPASSLVASTLIMRIMERITNRSHQEGKDNDLRIFTPYTLEPKV